MSIGHSKSISSHTARRARSGEPFHTSGKRPRIVPILGAVSCAFLAGPWTGRDPQQYLIAAILLAIGIALWGLTVLYDRMTGGKPEVPTGEGFGGGGAVN